MAQTMNRTESTGSTAAKAAIAIVTVVVLVVGFLVALELLTVAAHKRQVQSLVDQVAIDDDRAAFEQLLADDPDVSEGGPAVIDDDIPAGPDLDRITITTQRGRVGVACHGDVVFGDGKVVHIGEVWCTS